MRKEVLLFSVCTIRQAMDSRILLSSHVHITLAICPAVRRTRLASTSICLGFTVNRRQRVGGVWLQNNLGFDKDQPAPLFHSSNIALLHLQTVCSYPSIRIVWSLPMSTKEYEYFSPLIWSRVYCSSWKCTSLASHFCHLIDGGHNNVNIDQFPLTVGNREKFPRKNPLNLDQEL